jgi:glycine hydroxymethyltransferase
MDEIETLARDRACRCSAARTPTCSRTRARRPTPRCSWRSWSPGDTFASLLLADGGHLSHGMKINFSGTFYNPVHYPLHYDDATPISRADRLRRRPHVCLEHKPKMLLCGLQRLPADDRLRTLPRDRRRVRRDPHGRRRAHLGPDRRRQHPSPFPHCHVVTTTTHKASAARAAG